MCFVFDHSFVSVSLSRKISDGDCLQCQFTFLVEDCTNLVSFSIIFVFFQNILNGRFSSLVYMSNCSTVQAVLRKITSSETKLPF